MYSNCLHRHIYYISIERCVPTPHICIWYLGFIYIVFFEHFVIYLAFCIFLTALANLASSIPLCPLLQQQERKLV